MRRMQYLKKERQRVAVVIILGDKSQTPILLVCSSVKDTDPYWWCCKRGTSEAVYSYSYSKCWEGADLGTGSGAGSSLPLLCPVELYWPCALLE